VHLSNLLSSIAARVAIYRRRRYLSPRPVLGVREMTDIGIYRGHVDRVGSAEREGV